MTNKKHFRFFSLVAMFALLLALPVMAQEQTAAIQGTVTDASGAALPGVTVEAVSDKGVRLTAYTDSNGYYRFPSVPPGTYTVTANLEGLTPASVRADVRLGSSPRLDLALRPAAVAESIVVTGDAPIVDVTSSATATSIRSETFERLPKGRDFQSVVTQAAGANDESKAGGISIDGASGAENRYILDGVDTTDPQSGVAGKTIITDVIEEVQVKSAGYQAEFGGATGGVINVITKTGTNDFKGHVGAYYTDRGWGGSARPILQFAPGSSAVAEYFEPREDDSIRAEPGISIGGPILRDRLWFFGAYVPTMVDTTRTVTFLSSGNTRDYEQEFQRDNITANITGNAGARVLYKVAGNLSGYETTDTLPSVTGRGVEDPSLYVLDDEFTNESYSGYVDFIANPKWFVSARAGIFHTDYVQSDFNPTPNRVFWRGNYGRLAGRNIPGFDPALNRPLGFQTNPILFASVKDDFKRENIALETSFFPQLAGTHALKTGIQIENIRNEVNSGEQAPRLQFRWDVRNPYTGNRGVAGSLSVRQFQTLGEAESENTSIFVQDSWTTFNDRLTLNVGVRAEQEKVPSFLEDPNLPEYAVEWDYGDKLAPRLGFAFDIFGNAKTKAYGSYGVFYDIMKLELPRGSFGGDKWIDYQFNLNTADWPNVNCTPLSQRLDQPPTCTGATFDAAIDFRHPAIDSDRSLVDPDLKPMESNEWTIGAQHELTSTMGLGVRYVHKELVRTIEDVGILVDTGSGLAEEFFIANPGEGIAKDIHPGLPFFPKPVREYDAIDLEFTKRFANRWSLHATYTNSKLFGNYAGLANSDEAQFGSGRTDPNVARYGDSLYNAYDASGSRKPVLGRLATDRPNQIKAQVVYALPWGTSIGMNQFWGEGTPVSTEMYFAFVPFFPEGRGNLGRLDDLTQTDLYLQHDFKLFGDYGLQLSVNVMNLFDEDTEIARYQLYSDTDLSDHAGGPISDEAFFEGFDAYATIHGIRGFVQDPRYNKSSAFQSPREVRLGVKFTF